MPRLARYAWWVLGFNLAVIVWGAFVRASGSGAGCGSHWPLCNGTIVPHAPAVATLIEFGHRLTSGLALVGVVWLVVTARRDLARGAPARTMAHMAALLIVSEALIGAGLVLFEMVASNASVARAWWMSAHLTNTFLLLGALSLTAWYASGFPPLRLRGAGGRSAAAITASLATLVLGVSGAVTALGDTLYPASSLAGGIAQDLDSSSHLFVRLRVLHPVIAIVVGLAIIVTTRVLASGSGLGVAQRLARWCAALVVSQALLGAANVLLLAPVPIQLAHLLLADLVWITLVLTLATVLGQAVPSPVAAPGGDDSAAATDRPPATDPRANFPGGSRAEA